MTAQDMPFKLYTILTRVCTHRDVDHLLGNMLGLAVAGTVLVTVRGKRYFYAAYFGGAVVSGLISLLTIPDALFFGASSCVYAVVASASLVCPFGRQSLVDQNPGDGVMRGVPWCIFYGWWFLLHIPPAEDILYLTRVDHISHIGHSSGFLWGLLLPVFYYGRRYLVSVLLFFLFVRLASSAIGELLSQRFFSNWVALCNQAGDSPIVMGALAKLFAAFVMTLAMGTVARANWRPQDPRYRVAR